MPRTTKVSSVICQAVPKQAEEGFALATKGAANFQHRRIRGDECANALRDFLAQHLPNVFLTAKGEAIDFEEQSDGANRLLHSVQETGAFDFVFL
jgi:hypothetical protein